MDFSGEDRLGASIYSPISFPRHTLAKVPQSTSPKTPNSRAVHAPSADDAIGYDAGDTSPSVILHRVISPSSHPFFGIVGFSGYLKTETFSCLLLTYLALRNGKGSKSSCFRFFFSLAARSGGGQGGELSLPTAPTLGQGENDSPVFWRDAFSILRKGTPGLLPFAHGDPPLDSLTTSAVSVGNLGEALTVTGLGGELSFGSDPNRLGRGAFFRKRP